MPLPRNQCVTRFFERVWLLFFRVQQLFV